ncbi:MAG: type II toxin-antitoxin system RelE/ParE family toxin [Desulfurococcales archaeon]|nr:type II toxin-antitoxin system RelE/ParE family toxin [Desulfurococcales archaeon]
MEWKLRISKKALKFIENLPGYQKKRVLTEINVLLENLNKGSIPIHSMDIKRLKGKWSGFLRLRIGDLRVIFRLDIEKMEVIIYHIHHRGRVYK